VPRPFAARTHAAGAGEGLSHGLAGTAFDRDRTGRQRDLDLDPRHCRSRARPSWIDRLVSTRRLGHARAFITHVVLELVPAQSLSPSGLDDVRFWEQ